MTDEKLQIENTAFRFIEMCQHIESLDTLSDQLGEVFRELGFCWYMTDSLKRPPIYNAAYITDWPADHRMHYASQKYFRKDPAYQIAAQSSEPVSWLEARETLPIKDSDQVYSFAEEFGVRDGMIVPIHGSHGYKGFVSLAAANDCVDSPTVRAAAHMIGIYAHDVARKIISGQPQVSARRLTEREREVLVWAAAGKTDDEIGNILRISSSTAHAHIENAKRRFDVATRMQAVVEGMISGELSL